VLSYPLAREPAFGCRRGQNSVSILEFRRFAFVVSPAGVVPCRFTHVSVDKTVAGSSRSSELRVMQIMVLATAFAASTPFPA